MNVTMEFPATFDEFAEQYKLVDEQKIYTNGTELIPIYRAKQWLDNANAASKSEWISVEERLPEADTDVLVITANGSFKVARCNIYHNGTLVLWMTNDGLGEKAITHWMPLPELPKGDNDGQ